MLVMWLGYAKTVNFDVCPGHGLLFLARRKARIVGPGKEATSCHLRIKMGDVIHRLKSSQSHAGSQETQ